MTDHPERHIELVIANMKCDRHDAIDFLNDCLSFDEALTLMGLATEQGGDIVRKAGWKEQAYGQCW